MPTNKIYAVAETPVSFRDSGGTVAITLQNLGAGAGRISAQWDRGAGAQPMRYRARITCSWAATVTVGQAIELYLATSNGTDVDGTVGVVNAALTTEKRRNLQPVGFLIVDQTSANVPTTAAFTVDIYERYVSLGVWNATTVALQNTANTSYIVLTPYPDDIQAAS